MQDKRKERKEDRDVKWERQGEMKDQQNVIGARSLCDFCSLEKDVPE